ncbi:hypothetical protein GCM10010306_091460 [Streptomyces umbrinus]|nr:hypothetical protein GCM10010306_091460 [Streptomyces umbrinus]
MPAQCGPRVSRGVLWRPPQLSAPMQARTRRPILSTRWPHVTGSGATPMPPAPVSDPVHFEAYAQWATVIPLRGLRAGDLPAAPDSAISQVFPWLSRANA